MLSSTDHARIVTALADLDVGQVRDISLIHQGFMSTTCRVTLNTRSLIVKMAGGANLDTALAFDSYRRETAIYAGHDFPLPRPACLYCDFREEKPDTFLLVLEDLGDEGTLDQRVALNREQQELALTCLARLHGHYWHNSAGFTGFDTGAAVVAQTYAGVLADTADLLPTDIVQIIEHYLSAGLPSLPSAPAQTLIHGDFRADNLWCKDSRMIVLDWGDCAAGPALYDVTTLLATSIDSAARSHHEQRLIARYCEQLRDAGGELTLATAWDDYRRYIPAVFYNALLLYSLASDGARRRLSSTLARGMAQLRDHQQFLQGSV